MADEIRESKDYVCFGFDTEKEEIDGSRREYTQRTEHELEFWFDPDSDAGDLAWSYETWPERFDDSTDFRFVYKLDHNGIKVIQFDPDEDVSELFEHYENFRHDLIREKIRIAPQWSIERWN